MPRFDPHKGCNDFHRTTEAERRRFLSAPLTRRQVVGGGIGAALSIYTAKAMSLASVFEAAEADAAAAPNAPVLVSIFLPGGCDLLDTIVPGGGLFGRYADLHPNLKVENAPALGATGFGCHPSLAQGSGGGLRGLYEAGKVGVLPGIDYSNPDLSHFHSRHFWESGLVTPQASTGWLGRYLDARGGSNNPLQGISVSYSLSPSLISAKAPVAAVANPGAAQFWIPDVWGGAYDQAMALWGRLSAADSPRPGPAAATRNARFAKQVADRLAPFQEDNGNDPLAGGAPYPQDNDLASNLRNLAGLLSAPLGIKVATLEAPGEYDTHDDQKTELAGSLKTFSEAISAFQADLEQRGLANRVLTFVWSEFGRRPEENSSGTDHGAGGVAFLVGTRARSGFLTDYPSLTSLDAEDNLKVTVDFRRVYSSLLEQWLGTGADAVIPGSKAFGRLQLVT